MAQFKRQKLFVNLSQIDQNNMIYEEVWIYKLKNSEDVNSVGRYRIRYQKTDNPMFFAEDEPLGSEDIGHIQEAMSSFGPAIICHLEIWAQKGWKKCLDWLGDPSTHYTSAVDDLNEQYKSFLTGRPIFEPFISCPTPTDPVPRGKGPKKPLDDYDSFTSPKPSTDPNEFDWI